MLAVERAEYIMEQLKHNQFVLVADLSRDIGVSWEQ